jgi:vacuolar protein sorting-associated protein 13A/C
VVGSSVVIRLRSSVTFVSRSPPINIEDIGSVHFLLHHSDRKKDPELVKADIRLDGSTIFIKYGFATDGWPFMIENSSDYPVSFCQQVKPQHFLL